MATLRQIGKVARQIGKLVDAERVVLFGSHARGTAAAESDMDFLIVAESDLPRYKRSRALYQSISPYPFAMDLLVYTPEEIERGMRSEVSFISSVLREGKTLYVRKRRDRQTVGREGQERPA